MKSFKPFSVPVLVAAIAALALAYSVGASAARRPAPPDPVIAVIDLNGVLDGLTERADRETAHEKRKQKFQTEIDSLTGQIDDLRSRIGVASPADKPALQEELAILSVRRTAQLRVSEEILRAEQGKNLSELYAKISTSVSELAAQNGYTLVLINDANSPLPPADVEAVQQVAALRRVLYAAEGHDITQELTDFMNNRYAAGK